MLGLGLKDRHCGGALGKEQALDTHQVGRGTQQLPHTPGKGVELLGCCGLAKAGVCGNHRLAVAGAVAAAGSAAGQFGDLRLGGRV